MKKKGFTLIELLAVITVIAIIATITVIVTNKIIKNTKNTLLERQKLTIEEAARDYYLKEGMNANFDSKESCVNLSKLLSKGYLETKEVVNPKTKETMDGSVIITYSANQYNYKYQDTICHYSNGQVVYFDVTNGETCNNYTEENSNTGYNGIGGTGKQNGCMKFYAFNDDGGDTVNLLLDHNTTATIAWNSDGSNVTGPSAEFLNKLNDDTKDWHGTEIPTNYSINLGEGKSQYEVDYSNYKTRIITANEVARITNNTSWDEKETVNYYYFDSNSNNASENCTFDSSAGIGDISGCSYGWLYDRTYTKCSDYGCLNNSDIEVRGYWTISPMSNINDRAWIIYYASLLDIRYVNSNDSYGIRPVIEVLKSKLE